MPDLVVIAFPDAPAALRARAAFADLQADLLVDMEDVVVVTRSATGQVQLHQALTLSAAGPTGGTLWASLAGLLFLDPLLGTGSGALADLGLADAFLREVGGSLDGGGAALAALRRQPPEGGAADPLDRLGGRLLRTSLPADLEDRLRRRLENAGDGGAPPSPGLPSEDAAAAPPPGLAGAPGAMPGAVGAIPGTSHSASTEP